MKLSYYPKLAILTGNVKTNRWILEVPLYPMDPSTFLGSVWGIIYYHLEA